MIPDYISHKIPPTKHFITHHLQIMRFVVINGNPQRTILRQQLPDNFQAVAHQSQPNGMLQSVIIMAKSAAGIVGRVNKNAFYLAAKFLLQRL